MNWSRCPACGDPLPIKCKVKLADFNKNRRFALNMRWTVNARICTNCGVIRVINPHLLQGLESGYSDLDFSQIKRDVILNEMVLPGCHSEEEAIWCPVNLINPQELDDLSNGITTDQYHYGKLIHFLLLPQEERIATFGPCAMPVAMQDDGNMLRLADGRRRASILKALGATVIPLAVVRKTVFEKELKGVKQ